MWGLLAEANRRYDFEMLKPANAKMRDQLETEWFNQRRGYMTFEEWHQQLKLRANKGASERD